MKSKSQPRARTARRPQNVLGDFSSLSDEEAFAQGVALFNSRKFFRAHEAWEAVWLKAGEPDKTFLQGLIQVSAAFHHRSRGNRRGMESLLRSGLGKIARAPAGHRGLDLGALRHSAQQWLEALARGRGLEASRLPRIRQRG